MAIKSRAFVSVPKQEQARFALDAVSRNRITPRCLQCLSITILKQDLNHGDSILHDRFQPCRDNCHVYRVDTCAALESSCTRPSDQVAAALPSKNLFETSEVNITSYLAVTSAPLMASPLRSPRCQARLQYVGPSCRELNCGVRGPPIDVLSYYRLLF
jgi:hypothetical protein